LLPACLESLRAQSWRDFELLVVDNASSDDSARVVRDRFPEARFLQLLSNRGFSAAVNVGIARSSRPLVALLNQDVEVHSNWLQALAQAAENHRETGAFASRMMLYGQRDHFHSAGDLYGRDGIPVNRGVWQEDKGQYAEVAQVFAACGGAAAYRRSMLNDVGGFDESFFMYLEDVDLAWRHQLAGWGAVYVPEAVAYHHLSASGGGKTASFYTGRNTIYVLAKNMPAELLREYSRDILVAQLRVLREALRSWRGEAARARLRGQLSGLLTWPRMLRKREAIQRARRVSLDALRDLLQPVD